MRKRRNTFRNVVLSWAVLGAVTFTAGIGVGIGIQETQRQKDLFTDKWNTSSWQ